MAVFYSCDKDLYENGLQSEPNKISVKRISFKDLDSKTILKINEKIDHVNKICINENKNKITNKFVYDSNYGFYIDRDNGKLVNNNGEISYTFPMYRESEENLENIIFKPLDSGELDAYIAKYNLKPEEFVELTLEEQENLEPTLQRVYFGQFEYICVDYLSYENTCELVGADSEPIYDWVIVASFCSWVESGGGSSTDTNNGSSTGDSTSDTSGNYTGSSGGTGTGSGISTSPVTLTSKQLRDKCLKKNYLTSPQEQWLIDNPEIETTIIQYLESTVEDEFQGCYDEVVITNVKNFISVNQLLNQNENILLEIPCAQLPYWQTIAQHQVPSTVKTKIQNIDNQTGWFTSANIQSLGHPGNGAVVNMDFFPVTITQMPKWPSGVPYTQKELFNHIRLNINDFFDDLVFTPVVDSNYGLNEIALWNSTNPLGAILSININPDEGSVVCSKFNQITGEWYFTTIEVPWVGAHPVSGNRAFGYYTTQSGDMVIYTRGVDRYSFGTHMLGNSGATLEAASQLAAFNAADSKWQNFQQKTTNFVNQGQANGLNGASNINIPEKYRPNWNKVKNVLNGTLPISTLGCN